MDQRDHPTSRRGRTAAQPIAVRDRLQWTRQPAVGPAPGILGELRGRTIVEIGCGSGHNLAHLVARHGARALGVDHDPEKIRRARHTYGALPGIEFALDDAEQRLRALHPGSVDVCLSIFGAFSFTDPRPLLTAAAHALRPSGLLALTLRADDHHDLVTVLARRPPERTDLACSCSATSTES